MSKRAVILAGGKGTRLYPYTLTLPKPLVPIGDTPILEIVIRQLVRAGFDHITMAVNHRAEIIKDFCKDGAQWNVKIDYSMEDRPLSTMGPLKVIQDLPNNFLVMNGDILTDLDYKSFYDEHVRNQELFTISAYERVQHVDYGVLHIGEDNRLTGFEEKPAIKYIVSMGIYMANKKVLDIIPENQPYGFDELMLAMIKNNTPAKTKNFGGYWLDIGRPEDYEQANEELNAMRDRFLP